MFRSPIYSIHARLGAVFADYEGWEMPSHYGDFRGEHLKVRSGVGIADVGHRAQIRMTGEDRKVFLNRMVTNDVYVLEEGMGAYAAMLTHNGKMIFDMNVYCFQDSLLVDVEPQNREKAYQNLDKYIIADDVHMEDVTEQLGTICVQGPQSTELISAVLNMQLPDLGENHYAAAEFGDWELTIARTIYTGEIGYHIFAPVDSLEPLWNALCKDGHSDATPVGLEALDALRIEAGIPKYGPDMDENIMPPEAGLEERAINYEKQLTSPDGSGCYVGQETIAMIKYRGRVNKHIVGLEIECDLPPVKGEQLFKDDKQVGVITSAIFSPLLEKTVALGYVHRKYTDPGNELLISIDGTEKRAQVVALPFYSRS